MLATGGTDPFALTPEYSVLSHVFADGIFDAKYGGTGRVLNYTNLTDFFYTALAIQKDGKILLAGYSIAGGNDGRDYVLTRYNPDGSFDNSFGNGGNVITQGVQGLSGQDVPGAIIVQPDGKIVIGGTTAGLQLHQLHGCPALQRRRHVRQQLW